MTAMDAAGARTVADTIGGLFRSIHQDIRERVGGLDDEALNWQPIPAANSIAVLVVHTLGSEREMLHAVRQRPVERDRPSEFTARASAADLLALLEKADRELDELAGGLTADDLAGMRPRGDRPPKAGLEWLLTNYGHAREHLAQIDLTKQLYEAR
jgi:hypothetical protein